MHARNCRPMTHALKTSLMQVSILETRGERHSLPPTMTVMQVMMQPFGIMNALRGKISVPDQRNRGPSGGPNGSEEHGLVQLLW